MADEWESEDLERPRDPAVVAAKVKAAAARLRELALEAWDLYAVVGDGYALSKTIKPMSKRYEWREAAGFNAVGRDEELRFAARWAEDRAKIEADMKIPALAWSPRAILSAYGTWERRNGKRSRTPKLEIQVALEQIPRLYVQDEVEREHPDLSAAALVAARKWAAKANGGRPDPRLTIAALLAAVDRQIKEFATDLNMDGQADVNVGRAVKSEQGRRRQSYVQDGDDEF